MTRHGGISAPAVLLVAALSLFACAGKDGSPSADSSRAEVSHHEISDFSAEASAWADSVLMTMDTADLVGQLVIPASFTSADAATLRQTLRYVRDDRVGGIVWLRGDTLSMRLLADTLGSTARIPLFMAIDAEWGLAMRLEGTPEYPKNYRLGDASDDTLYDYGRDVGLGARRLGLNVVFAPVLDVSRGEESVMYARSYGADPAAVADKGCAFARGLADGGVLPVAKHFPGLGATNADSHRTLPVVNESRETILRRDLEPFRRYIGLDLGAIMTGHVYMPAIDSVVRPATLSPVVVGDILRGELGYDGLVFSDGMNMKALDAAGSGEGEKSRYVRALLAGADILVAPADTDDAIAEIREAVESGMLPPEVVCEKVRRILFYKYIYSRRLS